MVSARWEGPLLVEREVTPKGTVKGDSGGWGWCGVSVTPCTEQMLSPAHSSLEESTPLGRSGQANQDLVVGRGLARCT